MLFRLSLLFAFLYLTQGINQVKAQPSLRKRIEISNDIKLIPIADSVFVHVSYASINNSGRFASNGLIFIKNGKALMIDTPVNNELTGGIYNYLLDSMKVKVVDFIPGHYHVDCIGGLAFLTDHGVRSIANKMTQEKCREFQLPVPDTAFIDSMCFKFEGENVCCYSLGAGHTADNIVVYFPDYKILFGGCLVKAMEVKSIGNIADADVKTWPATIRKVKQKFPDVKVVVPGHGIPGGAELLDKTLRIVETYNLENH